MLCALVKIMPRCLKEFFVNTGLTVATLASCGPPSVNTGTLVHRKLKCIHWYVPPLIWMESQPVPSLERRRLAYPTHLQLIWLTCS